MRRFFTLALSFLFSVALFGSASPLLLPLPKSYERLAGSVRAAGPRVVWRAMTHAEEYHLEVTRRGTVITTADSAGLRAALSTFARLTRRGRTACCRVADWPDCAWRGLMIDVSRHLFPLSFLEKQIDLMASLKLNRLHLHLTDAGGWRMAIDSRPRLTELTAWRTESDWQRWWTDGDRRYSSPSQAGAYGGFYTKAQLRHLVAYAAARGITVVPEIEMPGHSDEVLAAYPELGCTDSLGRPLAGQSDLCPSADETFRFITDVLGEVIDVFPSEYVHVGGDESGMAGWAVCPRCRALMRHLGTDDPHRLLTHLMERTARWLSAQGRRLIAWDEVLGDGLPAGIAVQAWRGGDAPRRAAERGCALILSPTRHCYLNDRQNAPGTERLKGGMSFLPLSRVYEFRPRQLAAGAPLLGIEACLWTEYIATAAEAEYMLYPRLLALAELGWNNEPREPYASFRRRALRLADELREQGINAFDLRREKPARRASLHRVHHKALGCPVTYNKPFSRYFPAAGDSTLTDGRQGDWFYLDGRWQGFGSRGIDVTVDLQRSQTVRRVELHFIEAAEADLVLPAELRIEASTDGSNFAPVALLHPVQGNDSLPALRRLQWKGRTRARYLRLVATPPRAGRWLFTDEIIVR